MEDKGSKILFIFVSYSLTAVLAFWFGQKQIYSEVELNKPNVILADHSDSQRDLENEMIKLARDLKQEKESNFRLRAELTSARLILKPAIVTEAAAQDNRGCNIEDVSRSIIYNADFVDREKIFKALAQLDTQKTKSTLLAVVMNEQEDADLRSDLIRGIDWHEEISQAINLLHSEDESVKSAIVLAAQDSHFNEIEKRDFENELMTTVFTENSGEFIQIAAINYLANSNPEKISQITILSTDETIYANVSQHINNFFQN